MLESIIKVVNKMGAKEGKVEGIEFANMFGEVTINDIKAQDIEQGNLDNDNQNDDDNTATDNNHYEDAKEVEEEDKKACNLKEEVGDDELQRDYFNSNIDEISITNETDAEGDTEKDKDVDENGDTEKDNDVIDEAEDSEEEIEVEDDFDNEEIPEAEVEEPEAEEELEEEVVVAYPRTRHEVSSTIGSYWNELAGVVMETEKRVHNMMNEYYTMTA